MPNFLCYRLLATWSFPQMMSWPLVHKTGLHSLHSLELQVCPSHSYLKPSCFVSSHSDICMSLPSIVNSLSIEAWPSCFALYLIWLGSSVRLSLNTLNYTHVYNFATVLPKTVIAHVCQYAWLFFLFNLLEMAMSFFKWSITEYRKSVRPREMGSLLCYYLLGMSEIKPIKSY